MKVRLIELPADDPDGPGVRIRIRGDGWWNDMTTDEARAFLHAFADVLLDASRKEGFIDG